MVRIVILYYVTDARIPSERAHSIQVQSTVQKLSRKWPQTCLVVPRRRQTIWVKRHQQDLDWQPALEGIEFKRLPCIDVLATGIIKDRQKARLRALRNRIASYILALSFCVSLTVFFFQRRKTKGVIYTRDVLITAFLGYIAPIIGMKVIYEAHFYPMTRFGTILNRSLKVHGIVALNQIIRNLFQTRMQVNTPFVVAHDGAEAVQTSEMDEKISSLKIHPEDRIVLYLGHAYKGKGVEILIAAVRNLPNSIRDILKIVVVGGNTEDLLVMKEIAKKEGTTNDVIFTGHLPHGEALKYVAQADICVLPNTRTNHSQFFTSPMKLFEYMAVGKPIIASSLPSIRYVLKNEQNALLCQAEDPKSLAKAIERLIRDAKLAKKLGENAKKDFEANFTWEARAEVINRFLIEIITNDQVLV